MLISASDIIKKSIDLYKNNAKLFLTYSLLLLVPSTLITLASFSLSFSLMISASIPLGFLLYGLLIVCISLGTLWISISFIHVIAARYEDRESLGIGENFRRATPLVLPTMLVGILTGLAVVSGIILFIIPGIIFAIWFGFSFYSVILDNKRGLEALKYSKLLVSGRWWGVVWRLFAPALFFGITLSIIQWLIGIPFGVSITESSGEFSGAILVYTILSGILTMLFVPLNTAAPTILYEELKKTMTAPIPELPHTSKLS